MFQGSLIPRPTIHIWAQTIWSCPLFFPYCDFEHKHNAQEFHFFVSLEYSKHNKGIAFKTPGKIKSTEYLKFLCVAFWPCIEIVIPWSRDQSKGEPRPKFTKISKSPLLFETFQISSNAMAIPKWKCHIWPSQTPDSGFFAYFFTTFKDKRFQLRVIWLHQHWSIQVKSNL